MAALAEPRATLHVGGALRGGLLGVASALADAAARGESGAPNSIDALLALLRLLELDSSVAKCVSLHVGCPVLARD